MSAQRCRPRHDRECDSLVRGCPNYLGLDARNDGPGVADQVHVDATVLDTVLFVVCQPLIFRSKGVGDHKHGGDQPPSHDGPRGQPTGNLQS